MSDNKRRLLKIEGELMNREKHTLCCVGIVGDPESETNYQAYLASGIQKPFIWIDTGIRRPALDLSDTTSTEDENDHQERLH